MPELKLETEQELKDFKKTYDNAVNQSKSIFIFKGHEILTDYAKHLIEFTKTEL